MPVRLAAELLDRLVCACTSWKSRTAISARDEAGEHDPEQEEGRQAERASGSEHAASRVAPPEASGAAVRSGATL